MLLNSTKLLSLLNVIFIAACSATHETTRSTVTLKIDSGYKWLRPITVASIDHDESGIMLMSVGTEEIGEFNDVDQANIEGSLQDTLKEAIKDRVDEMADAINVYIMIRKYFVGSSNNAGVVWAGIDWCVVDHNKQILFQETFYSTATIHFVGTLGELKDLVNRSIVKRISHLSIILASNKQPEKLEVAGTYANFEEAAITVPKTLQSWHAPTIGGLPGLVGGTAPERLPFDRLRIQQPINWTELITNTH